MKILLGGQVSRKDVYNYKPMKSGRFSTILNEINDRGVVIITDPELLAGNVLDVDKLRALYEKNQK